MIRVAATQMTCGWDLDANLDHAEELVREASARDANIVLLQELFATPYFCPDQKTEYFALAHEAAQHPFLSRFASLARELDCVLPVSFFERANNAYFNSVMVIDADGTQLGVYRKSHLPQGPGYEEKFYFNPGDTGFCVWDTAFGRIGVGICWDQWFPECARAMALSGADVLFYPTAIGSEPQDAALDSREHWQRVMQGHAGANLVGLVASNRIGVEHSDAAEMTFYGHSFIADETGAISAQCDGSSRGIVCSDFNLKAMQERRAGWGVFRDRRVDLYGSLCGFAGR